MSKLIGAIEDQDTKALIDPIIYLASLTSDPHAIDSSLDKLRRITARWNTRTDLPGADKKILREVRAQIESYLFHKDPLQIFTPELLEQKMYERFEGKSVLRKLQASIAIIIGLSLGMAALAGMMAAIVFKLPPDVPVPVTVLTAFVTIVTVFAVLDTGALILLLLSVRSFRVELKKAYSLICLGLAIMVATQLHLPFIVMLQATFWAQSWLYTVLFAVSAYILYLGFRKFAINMRIDTQATNIRKMSGGMLAAAMIGALLPHAQAPFAEYVYDISTVSLSLVLFLVSLTLYMGILIVRKIGQLYKPAISSMLIAISFMGTGHLLFLVVRLGWISPEKVPHPLMFAVPLLCFVVSGFLYLQAGYLLGKSVRR